MRFPDSHLELPEGRRHPLRTIGERLVAISRGGELLRFDDSRAAQLQAGDALVEVVSRR